MRKIGAKAGLLAGGLLAGVLLAETGARLWKPSKDSDLLFNSPESSPMGLYVLDEGARIVPAPGFSATVQSPGYRTALRTNALGLRGPPAAEVGGRQWMAAGDSFTMAVQVEEEESFPGLLGEKAGAHIWNAGVDGYSTWQALIRYEQLASLPLEQVVLTFFTGNDFQDNERFPHMRKAPLPGKPGDPIPRASVPWHRKLLLRHSRLYAHYRIAAHRAGIQSGKAHQKQNWRDELSIFTRDGSGRLRGLGEQTRKALEALKRSTEARGAKLLVAVAPPAFVVDRERAGATFSLVGLDPAGAALDAPQQKAAEILGSLGIRHCDLSEALRSGQEREAMYFTFDGHWTPAGHRVVAKRLSQCLGAG